MVTRNVRRGEARRGTARLMTLIIDQMLSDS